MLSKASHSTPDERNLVHCLKGGGEMGALMRAHDWSTTAVGPVEQWPQSLCTAISICLNSRYPMLIWWGPELIMLYNDAYRPILGSAKHPRALGQRGQECWPEIWSIIGPMLEGVLQRGEATWSDDQLLLLDRNGYLEECYFTFSYSPIIAEESGGIFTAVTETTARVLSERRLRTFRELGARVGEARTAERACQIAAETLASNRTDLPFALLYLLAKDGQTAQLAGASGLFPGTPASPAQLTLAADGAGNAGWPLTHVLRTGKPEQVTQLETKFAGWRDEAWSVAPHSAMVLPIAAQNSELPAGLLIAGVSPHRAIDEDYRGFFELVAGHIATAVANAQAYEEERKRVEALADLDRAKTIFFTNISHEFRTPLTLMLGPLADILADTEEALSPAQRARLELVQRNSTRLLKLVNTLLDFARIEAGRMQAVYEPTDLATFTTELASVFRAAVEKAGLQFQVDCPPLPELIYVDREMWEKIVLNLISNAFKFTLAGQISVRLRPIIQPGGPQIELTVRDTGVGIPAEQMPHLFERFHRIDNVYGRAQEGSGIGLALVQELVHLHGGGVHATSVAGQGSTFYVTIPIGKMHLPADRLDAGRTIPNTTLAAAPYVEEALRWLPPAKQRQPLGVADDPAWQNPNDRSPTHQPAQPAQQKARILLVDDNVDLREYLTHLLELRYRVEPVADGEAALQAAAAQTPDLVLTDVMMPQMDGFELLRRLRGDPKTRGVPVIMLSARAGEEARVEGLETGADDYLIKPFSARELLARVQAHLDLQRVRQEAAEQLRQREERYRLAARATNDAIWDWDLTTNQVEWSEAIGLRFGHVDAVQGTDAQWRPAQVHPEDHERIEQSIQAALAHGGERWSAEYRFRCADGHYAHVFDRGFVLRAADGQAQRMIGAILDISERKQAEEELQHLNETLEQRVAERTAELKLRNQELDQFAYVASHDLRAPLRAIEHLTSWIKQDAEDLLPAPSLTHLTTLGKRVKRMENLLNDLLAYSRAGRVQHQPERVDTGALVTNISSCRRPLDLPSQCKSLCQY